MYEPDWNQSRNLFRADNIFRLFNNLQSIHFVQSSTFSFSFLLSMISGSSSLQTITIYGQEKFEDWASESERSKLILMFNENHFDIDYYDGTIYIAKDGHPYFRALPRLKDIIGKRSTGWTEAQKTVISDLIKTVNLD